MLGVLFSLLFRLLSWFLASSAFLWDILGVGGAQRESEGLWCVNQRAILAAARQQCGGGDNNWARPPLTLAWNGSRKSLTWQPRLLLLLLLFRLFYAELFCCSGVFLRGLSKTAKVCACINSLSRTLPGRTVFLWR